MPGLLLKLPIALVFALSLSAAIAGFWKMGDLAAPSVIALVDAR